MICQIFHLPSNNNVETAISLRFKIILTFCLSVVLTFIPILAYIYDDFWLNQADTRYSLVYLGHAFVLVLQNILMGYEFKKQIPSPWYINLLFWSLISLLYLTFLMNSVFFLVLIRNFLLFSLIYDFL